MDEKSHNIKFPKMERVTFLLRQDLADQLPKENPDRRNLLNKAIEHYFALQKGRKASSPAKAAAARENGKAPCQPGKIRGRPKGQSQKKPELKSFEWLYANYLNKSGTGHFLLFTYDDYEVLEEEIYFKNKRAVCRDADGNTKFPHGYWKKYFKKTDV
jgi:hypothetical protein